MRKRALLFGMTGSGNNAFKALREHPLIELVGVFTLKRKHTPFPYYECEQLNDTVTKSGIALYEGFVLKDRKTQELIQSLQTDVLVVCTFDQIIPQAVISLPKRGVINIHPSLLPRYRGSIPTVCALLNGDKETGVTAHFIEDEKIDSGRIIAQAKIKIDPSDTDGNLRFKLAVLSEQVLTEALTLALTRDKAAFPAQDESAATYCPKRASVSPEINMNGTFKDMVNTIRAMTPHPGAYVTYEGKRHRVAGAVLQDEGIAIDTRELYKEILIVNTPEGMVKFHVSGVIENG